MFIIIQVNQVKFVLDFFEHRTRGVFLGASKGFKFRVEISNKHDIIREVVYGLEKRRVRISIRAVNGSQNEVLAMRKFKVDCQGFVVGYDIEIFIPIFFVDD